MADYEQLIGTFDLLESIEAGHKLFAHMLSLTAADVAAEVPEPEALPCNPDNVVWVAIQALLSIDGGITPEVVAEVAGKSRLAPARAEAILCGDEPTAGEIEQLAQVAGVGARRFEFFLRAAAEEIKERSEQPLPTEPTTPAGT